MVKLTKEELAELPAIKQRVRVRQEALESGMKKFKQSVRGDSFAGVKQLQKKASDSQIRKNISSAAEAVGKGISKSLRKKAVYKKGKAFGGTYDLTPQLNPIKNYSTENPHFKKEWEPDKRSLFFK